MLIVGLDAAAQLTNFGYAIGQFSSERIEIETAGLLSTRDEPDALASTVAPRLRGEERALIAIDAPLGWPAAMGDTLHSHSAGEVITPAKDSLFKRATDLCVARTTGKVPLEVGGDKIARAAHTALEVLHRLRELTGKSIPLAWSRDFREAAAIEVYPAATLKCRGIRHSQYKKADQLAAREEIARKIAGEMIGLERYLDGRADVFDAALCLLAAKDFLEGLALPPQDLDLARKEGWIWVTCVARYANTKSRSP